MSDGDTTIFQPAPLARPRWMSDLYTEHHEELEFLWSQRMDDLYSHEYLPHELKELDDRIESHVQALLVPGMEVVPMVEWGLNEDNARMAFATAYPLLRLNDGLLSERIVALLGASRNQQRLGLIQALCFASIDSVQSRLEQLIRASEPVVALAAAKVLACHNPASFRSDLVSAHARAEDPLVRTAAWELARHGRRFSDATYEQGLNDSEADVREAAQVAAGWGGYTGLLHECRNVAQIAPPDLWHTAYMIAILGDASDTPHILAIGDSVDFGPARFTLLGTYGHPKGMDIILNGLSDGDPETANAAGLAFTKITGLNIESEERAQAAPESSSEPDDFDAEITDEFVLPDAELAREHWTRLQPQFSRGTRWCRGHNISKEIPPAVIEQVDLQSRYELCLRSAHAGTVLKPALDLERYPTQ